jgi:hypothetical protein
MWDSHRPVFYKNIITSYLFLDILENHAIPQVKNNNKLIL